MTHEEITRRLEGCEKVLVGLGEEWKLVRGQYDGRREQVCRAYQALYELLKDKDYFIITMATDAVIYETLLGSSQEQVKTDSQDARQGQ